ncbi:hypothetical protein L202_06226 [Cryptococcus amylolentus CBS 6039]|uniref:Uncharacterized protein n=1 Tax=Cryptococcus amylolentus CBS 6039 TaxID=1295533 RepID=A0A1E3HIX3_9TREE|nr:hypothetical protein L202_06226 [Cryptococcus amylolentus CBS 6039]ODN76300.1 hypothetical protein L202_06226 [Cryptococcus amylolentus CBS 6039]
MVIYELPRRTDTGNDEWLRQFMMTEVEIAEQIEAYEYSTKTAANYAEERRGQKKSRRLRWRSGRKTLAPHEYRTGSIVLMRALRADDIAQMISPAVILFCHCSPSFTRNYRYPIIATQHPPHVHLPLKTTRLHCDLTTLSPLPSEVISLIYAYYLAQNPLESKSQFLDLLVLSKKVYSENAWRLYDAVELNDQNHKAFFDGLWSAREIDVCAPCPPYPPFLRCEASALAREIEGYSHHKRWLKRPSHIPSEVPYQNYELYIDCWQVFVGLRKGNESVRDFVNAWTPGHDFRHAEGEASRYTWISDSFFFAVTHLSFGRTVSLDAPHTSDERFALKYKSFGPALKHVCLSFNDTFYDLEGEYEEAAQLGHLEESEVDEMSLTLHNAWPDDFEPGLADTMIYELPRNTANGDGDWKRQIAMMTWEMEAYMFEWEERMQDDRLGANVWRPTMKPWKIRFTNMAPIPPNTDIVSAILNDYPLGQDEHFDGLFRKWWEEVVSFEGPVKCACCEIFRKRHPKVGVLASNEGKTF